MAGRKLEAKEMIRKAEAQDIAFLAAHDVHVSKREFEAVVRRGRVYVACREEKIIGWLRYGLFWDNTPFMNMLMVVEPMRGQGIGRMLVTRWEADMRAQGFNTVMTSTASDEDAQGLYRHLGYRAVGGFLPEGEPYELIFIKQLEGGAA